MDCLIDIQKTCRTCLEETDDLENIFESSVDGLMINYILKTILPVYIDEKDLLSNKICHSCIQRMTLSHQFLELCIESDRNVRSVLEGSDTEILHVEEKKEPQEPKEEIVELFDIEYADSEKVEQDFIVESLEPESSTDSKDPKIEQSSLATIDEPVDNGEEYLEEIIDEEKIEIKDSTKLCMFCTEEFSTTELFQLHLRSHKHNLDNRIFSCSPCDNLIFDTLKELQTHSETHRKMFSCEKCPEKFTLIADFTTHQAQNCGNSKFKCQICYEYFDKREKLKKHLRDHNIGKKYCCTKCDKFYNDSSNLKRHLIRHSGIRIHICHRCPQKFAFSSELRSHIRTHDNLRPFPCSVCEKSFTKSSSLVQHTRIHTKERPFVCDFCKSSFISADHLRRHSRVHTNEKPYKCDIEGCTKAFIQRQDYVKHMKLHNGANFYKCEICSMGFTKQSQLKAHWPSHYPPEDSFLEVEHEIE